VSVFACLAGGGKGGAWVGGVDKSHVHSV